MRISLRGAIAALLRPFRFLRPLAAPILACALLAPGCWFAPARDTLHGPRRAVLRSNVPGLELGVTVRWYDLGLNKQPREERLVFGPDGELTLPDYVLPTTFGRLWLKRRLEPRGRWTECSNCYGPTAYASLYRTNDYGPPAWMRLTQHQTTEGETVFFDVGLILDETQFEERPLRIDDLDALKAEVRAILASGTDVNVPEESFGPALRRLNPVRAERERDALRVWMGGNVGYTISPDAPGGSLLNGAWLSGTDYPGIQKIERM